MIKCDRCKDEYGVRMMHHYPAVFEGRAQRPQLWCDACVRTMFNVGPNDSIPCPYYPGGSGCQICGVDK